jgi:PAS domain S-box-containing protein
MRIGNWRRFSGISDHGRILRKLEKHTGYDSAPVFHEKNGRRLLEISFDGIWAIDAQLRTRFVNRRMARMLGYSPEEMAGRNLLEFMFPEDVPAEREAIARRRRGISEEFEIRYRRKDGTELWARVSTVPIFDDRGEFEGAIGVHSDVTDRKLAEQALRRREAELSEAEQVAFKERKTAEEAKLRLAAIVESSYDPIVSKDLNGVITSWNAAATRMFGYSAEEAVGKSIMMLIPPELQEEENVTLSRLRAGERIEHLETQRVRKDGERLEVSLTISPIKDSTGAVIGASKIARDITQRKRTEEALRISEKIASVGRLAATVAHEINNPLESVVNLVYLAKTGANDPSKVMEYLSTAEEELGRIAHLTKQTLGFYREQAGIVPVRAGELLRQLIFVLSAKTRNKRVNLDLELADDPDILVNAGEIRQLFANFLNNSIDACNSGGSIRVRVSRHFSHRSGCYGLRVTVADNGTGIRRADRERLFQPFFTTKKDVGNGLGLWVCKEIVERHAGRITVRSDATPGRSWTAISVFLPALHESKDAFREVA